MNHYYPTKINQRKKFNRSTKPNRNQSNLFVHSTCVDVVCLFCSSFLFFKLFSSTVIVRVRVFVFSGYWYLLQTKKPSFVVWFLDLPSIFSLLSFFLSFSLLLLIQKTKKIHMGGDDDFRRKKASSRRMLDMGDSFSIQRDFRLSSTIQLWTDQCFVTRSFGCIVQWIELNVSEWTRSIFMKIYLSTIAKIVAELWTETSVTFPLSSSTMLIGFIVG